MPPRQQHREQPLTTLSLGPWLVNRVRSALTALSSGRLAQASRLAAAMLTDDRIGGVLDVRVSTLLGLPLQLAAADDSAAAAEALARLEAGDRKLLQALFPRGRLKKILSQSLLLGVVPVETVWDTAGGSWLPTLRPWSPEWLTWEASAGWGSTGTAAVLDRWQLQTAGAPIYLPADPDPDEWTLFAPLDQDHPYRWGLVLRLAILWLLRSWMLRDWGRWGERHGLATVLGRTPGAAPEAQRRDFMKALVDLASDPVVEAPLLIDPTTGQEIRFDVDLLEASSNSWRGFDRLWDRLDTSIAVAIAGQNLTSEVQSGSLAAARVHDRIRRDILEADAGELASWQQQILRRWAHWNFGDGALAPRLSYDTEPPAEGDLGREVLEAGVVRVDELRGRHGLPPLGEEGGGQGFVRLGDRDPGAGMGLAGPRTDSSGGWGLGSAMLARRLDPNTEGMLFLDTLGDQLLTASADAMAPQLDALLEVVKEARGYADLRRRVLALYKRTPEPEAFAELLRGALVLSELAGRASVAEGG